MSSVLDLSYQKIGGAKMEYKIREFREERHMSQQELAEKSGVSRATLSGLENGKIEVTTTETLIKIATALEKKVSDIFLN